MKFGSIPTATAEGSILAHSHRVEKRTFKKGRTLSAEDIVALLDVGYEHVIAATLEAGDIGEDLGAARLAALVKGPGLRSGAPFTGRCNLFAETRWFSADR